MLKSINNDDLAPPPSDEDIFGQIESIKKQFEEENSQLTRQLEENKVDIDNMVFYPTIGSTYFVKTQTYVALFGPHQLSIIFSGVMYLELSPL